MKIVDETHLLRPAETQLGHVNDRIEDPDVALAVHVELWVHLFQLSDDVHACSELRVSVANSDVALLVLLKLPLLLLVFFPVVLCVVVFIVIL